MPETSPPPPRRRRDPRAERETRRLAQPGRPRFALPSPPQRIRRDPRAEAEALSRPGPPPRLERSASPSLAPPASPPFASPPPRPAATERRRSVPRPAFFVCAILEDEAGRDAELLGAAQILAGMEGAVLAVLSASAPPSPDTLGTYGADRWLALPPLSTPEAEAACLTALIRHLQPRHVLFAETERGGDLARRVAAASGLPLFPDVEALSVREAVRPLAHRVAEEAAPPAPLLTLRPERIAPYAGAPAEACPFPLSSELLAVLEAAAREAPGFPPFRPFRLPPEALPLTEAELVLAAGAGVRDIGRFLALARALGAGVGGSRVVCDAGLLPRAAQIGASGTVIAPRAYVAFGISGAPQHLQGITEAGFVAAINTDPAAPIMARADLAIPLDAEAVIAALAARLAERGRAVPPHD
jgi:electron transfer flavoprotein alpha subunit